ncbi:MAG: competence/damage-inducible protein A [Deltaproteobacteria bacterium]|nr:competence/damage-inducible protein A [Deltaproteobacteria bacterium]
MEGEIITIGTELVSGRTLDLNAWYAAGRLAASGLQVTRITSVGDDYDKVSDALTRALAVSRFVIVTGGLGATDDDITSEIVAGALDRPLCLDKQMFQLIKHHSAARGLKVTASMEKMAWMPRGSRMLNPEGTACGFCLMEKDIPLYFLPGVPDQMRYLMDNFVLPEIIGLFETLPVVRQRVLKLYGLNEPSIAEMLGDLRNQTKGIVFGFYPNFPENHITLSLRGQDETSVLRELDRVKDEIKRLVGPGIFSEGSENMEEIIGQGLAEKDLTLSTAESCTGGLIGHRLTNVPGSSAYYMGGMVVYSNQAKIDLLGVSAETLEAQGAVSDRTVREMAEGVRRRMQTDLGLAVTGIAGPDGATKDKPVGTVHLGLAVESETFSRKYRFWGTREQVKHNTSMMALDWIRRYMNGYPFLPGL